ncbi:uncharacterized protein [Nicotiana tomentosiformis]|uniref:uncharacterized protein n=1 Tax=Nicotiana tomentosiformis TaxID=4098 RepID=UPI00388C9C52
MRLQGRLCVPNVDGLRDLILQEYHSLWYSIHPSAMMMYRDLKQYFSVAEDEERHYLACFTVFELPASEVELSTIFHPQIDCQSEQTIQILEDILRGCVIHFKGHWHPFLLVEEFAYSNSYHSSTEMALCEALHSRRCRYPIGWFDPGEVKLLGIDLVCNALEMVKLILELLHTS